jgi:hypothetical protein
MLFLLLLGQLVSFFLAICNFITSLISNHGNELFLFLTGCQHRQLRNVDKEPVIPPFTCRSWCTTDAVILLVYAVDNGLWTNSPASTTNVTGEWWQHYIGWIFEAYKWFIYASLVSS